MLIEPIADIDSTELYIKDLEAEIDKLQDKVNRLTKQLEHKPKIVSQKDYDRVCALLQQEINKHLPF